MIRKLHYFAGITISVFVGIHLLNQIMVYAGDQAHIEFMIQRERYIVIQLVKPF